MRFKCKICGSICHEEICKICENIINDIDSIDGIKDIEMEKVQVPFCNTCNMPSWNSKDNKLCSACNRKIETFYPDIIPVFVEEKILLSVILKDKIYNKNVWNMGANRYLVDGERVRVIHPQKDQIRDIYKEYQKLITTLNFEELLSNEHAMFQEFICNNKERFKKIEIDAHEYIQKVDRNNAERVSFVSFSGGKDSVVVSDLVRQALSKHSILHIFGDTTLEMDETLRFIKEFKEKNPLVPFIDAVSERNFMDLCKIVGPPTRMNDWCCSIFKSGPISQTLNSLFPQEKSGVKYLTYYGIRAKESLARSKYGRTSDSPKITSQRVASPIFGWLDYDIWLYLLTRDLPINQSYRYGYRRVGCWCCPNNSGWSEFLNEIHLKDKQGEWKKYLYKFAKKIGKEDYEVYVDDGYWKARHGGIGLYNSNTKIEKTPCIEKNIENIILKKPYSKELDEYLKPFGQLSKSEKNGDIKIIVYEGKSNKKQFNILAREDSKIIKLDIIKDKHKELLRHRIECQFRKYQLCIQCSACDSICQYGAISTFNNKYKIDEKKCIHCLDCVAKTFTGGCLINETLKTKEDKDEKNTFRAEI